MNWHSLLTQFIDSHKTSRYNTIPSKIIETTNLHLHSLRKVSGGESWWCKFLCPSSLQQSHQSYTSFSNMIHGYIISSSYANQKPKFQKKKNLSKFYKRAECLEKCPWSISWWNRIMNDEDLHPNTHLVLHHKVVILFLVTDSMLLC